MNHDESELVEVRLKSRPSGKIIPEVHFEVVRGTVPERHTLPNDSVLIKVLYISMDPAMRGWVSEKKSYIPPVKIGAVMRASGVGVILASRSKSFSDGDFVSGMLGWRSHAVVNERHLEKISEYLPAQYNVSLALGVLGGTGLTGYFGLLSVGQPTSSDTVLVSAAAGATGSVVLQIAKNVIGCKKVVGIAGGTEKCAFVKEEMKADSCIDYRKCSDESLMVAAIQKACPNGIDVYFDSVGGFTLAAVMRRLNPGARIVLCGAISSYNDDTSDPSIPSPSLPNYLSLLVNRARIQGFIVFDFQDQYAHARTELSQWLQQGLIKSYEHKIVEAVDRAPHALNQLFSGNNIGKTILDVSKPRAAST
eukprot:CAMPEP_0182445794 /NCGR_PEP_ID=MMETSP1172-20130603/3793_1 /TAXON_ID=708627 /ORGANISM="Timspurckia oligopyrenoides, Strain CCMP3278" /LENGTH=363 /DNA_ID=CAMNT_0024641619 /DNA_START=111 /DNA_END=1198 /DNA_ORIENTATION=+